MEMLKCFEKGEFRVETIEKEDRILFEAKDIAKSLGYKKTENAVERHVSEKYKVKIASTRFGGLDHIYLEEPGLYELIFSSHLPEAKRFRDWVFEEILPTIRKTGRYEMKSCLEKLKDIEKNLTRQCEQSKECRNIVININNNMKDPTKVEMGQKGGMPTAKKHRDNESRLVDLEEKLASIVQIVNE